jgi:Tol biopolymer transport system component
LKPQKVSSVDQDRLVLGDDGELVTVEVSNVVQGKKKRKRGTKLIGRYGLFQALKQVVLIGIPISLFTVILMLQAMGIINVLPDDGKIHFERTQACTSIDKSVAADAMHNSGGVSFVADKSRGIVASAPDGIPNLYFTDANGKLLNRVTSNTKAYSELPIQYDNPRWSPNSSKIAFNLIHDKTSTGYATSVYLMNADGSNIHLLTGNYNAEFASWNPDGSSLAFVTYEMDGEKLVNTTLYTVDIQGSNIQKVASAPRHIWSKAVQWSPDGKWIAFTPNDEVDVISPDGKNNRQVLATLATVIMWSPDGRYLILGQTGHAYAVDSATFSTACRLDL